MFSYDNILSERAVSLQPSGIRKFFDMLSDMKDVISLTVGQPDFVTPWHIREAGIKSLEGGHTYYTSNSGINELRQAVSNYQLRRFGLNYSPKDEIIITAGSSEAIDLAFRTLINQGDEVIIPEPSFVCYAPLVIMAGGVPVTIPLKQSNNFKLTPDELKSVLTPKTKILILPFPNNPTGAVMTAEELKPITDIIRKTNIAVLSDEIYGELSYGNNHTSIASFADMRERTVIVSGVSKSHAMTGWRIGYSFAPADITKQMLKIHQYGIMCAPITSQHAAVEALNNGDGDVEMMKAEYDSRRKYVLAGLEEAGISCFVPQGAFYVFPDISPYGMTSEDFCQKLLKDKKVAIVPGNAFGKSGEGFVRISYAYSLKHLDRALKKIKEFVEEIDC